MPAAAVIPAPLAYTIIVAVKRLVVGLNYFNVNHSHTPTNSINLCISRHLHREHLLTSSVELLRLSTY